MGKMMTAKINLAKLHHVVQEQKGKDGMVEVLVIPIAKNNLFKSEKGAVYLDTIAFEVENTKFDDTHIIKQSLPKEVREKQTEEEKKAMPILGNLNANFSGGGSGDYRNASPDGKNLKETDDLPF